MRRLATGLVLAVAIVAAVFMLPSDGLLALLAIVGAWGALEFYRLVERMSPPAPVGPLFFCTSVVLFLALVTQAADRLEGRDLVLAAGTMLLAVGATPIFRAREPNAGAVTWSAWVVFAPVYITVTVSAIYELHRLDPWLVFGLLAFVALGDTAAYYAGRRWGRHPLAPRLSPKKTREGSAAAVLAAVFAATAFSLLRYERLDWVLVLLAAVTQVAGQLGDLVESALKRGAGVKDSGTLLPGHGGVLDRCDAMLLAAPVFYFGCRWLGEGRWY